MRRWLTWVFTVVTVAVWPAFGWAEPPGGAPVETGPVIHSVDWGELGGLNQEELERASGLVPGNHVTPRRVREAIRALAELDDVRRVTVRSQEDFPNQVSLKVTVIPVRRVERIDVQGAEKFEPADLVRVSRLAVGAEADQQVLAKAAERIRQLYLQKGYFDVQVEPETVSAGPAPGPERVVVRFSVTEGKPVRVGWITFPGLPKLSENGLPAGVRWKSQVDKRFDAERLRSDMERLRRHLEQIGYLNPQVGPHRVIRDERGVGVMIPVRVRERVRVTVEGHRHIKKSKILSLLDLPRQRTLAEARRRVEAYLHNDGYRAATVKLSATRFVEKALYEVKVVVDEGPRYRAVSVRFEGNRALPDNELERLVDPGWRVLAEPVREKDIADRADVLTGAFRGIGFPDAEVTYTIAPKANRAHRAEVTYHVDEGRRWWFRDARLEGVADLDPRLVEALTHDVGRLEGLPFRRDRLRSARARLAAIMGEYGFVDSEVEALTTSTPHWTGQSGLGGTPIMEMRVDTAFRVSPGPQVRVGTISLAGKFRTRPYVVYRELAFAEGDLLTPSAIAETRRRLFRAASFDLVRIQETPANDDGTVRNITIHLSEGKPGVIELGIGYGEQDGVRTLVDLSYRDLFRRGHRAGIRLRYGQLRRLASLNYAFPWVGSYRANVHSRLLYEEEDLVSFDRVTRAAEVGIQPNLTDTVVLGVTYRLEFNRFPRLPEDQVSTLAGRRRINVGSILTSVVRDTRDDPFTPSRGSVIGLSYEQGAKVLLSEIQFGKATMQLAGYHQVSRRAILAGKFQTGRVRRLFESTEVPVSERFFMGGQSTLRGYALDSVGVPGETLIDGVPQGGEVMLLTNVELRLGGREGLGLVFFVDAGNVWNLGRSMGVNDLRVGAGPGLHYATPVGPIRLDLGYKIDRRDGESPYRLHFTLGHTF